MAPGAPREARWVRSEPRRVIPAEEAERMVRHAFPRGRIIRIQPLAGGLRNGNFKLTLDSATEPIVLRVYEHDASLCQKEADLIRLVGGSVPVPEVILAEPARDDHRPFVLLRYVEGVTFRELVGNARAEEVAAATRSVGETLAAIGAVTFANPGWLGPGPTVTEPLLPGSDPMPRFVDQCLASPMLRKRVPVVELRDKTQAAMWSHASALRRAAEETSLVHGDFSRRNLILRESAGRWVVAAVLDWEFAVSSSPLADVGHFLRYERSGRPAVEPHFRAGYLEGGGRLPPEWRRLARLVDLVALCEVLTHDGLSDATAAEVVGMIRATVDDHLTEGSGELRSPSMTGRTQNR